MTYYAVFAKATTQEGPSVPTKVTFDFGSMGLSGEIKTPFVKEGVTITFDKATAGTPPTFYTDAIRLYAGGTMTVAANAITQIDLTFGASDKNNEISANTGTYSKENSQWTGSANEVVFTIGGTSGHRRFATVAVNMSGQGSVTTYSRYITSCQAATEVETLNTLVSARKILTPSQANGCNKQPFARFGPINRQKKETFRRCLFLFVRFCLKKSSQYARNGKFCKNLHFFLACFKKKC